LGSFSHTSVPQIAPPQLAMRTWLSFSAVYQVPSGLAAEAGETRPAQPKNTLVASPKAAAALRLVLIATSMVVVGRMRNV
jgi:hypothetical protein